MENIILYIIVFLTGFLFAWIIFYKIIKKLKNKVESIDFIDKEKLNIKYLDVKDNLDQANKIIPKLKKELEDLKTDKTYHKGIISGVFNFKITRYGEIFSTQSKFTAEIKEIEKTDVKSKIQIIGDYHNIKVENSVDLEDTIQIDIFNHFNNSWIETKDIEFYEIN